MRPLAHYLLTLFSLVFCTLLNTLLSYSHLLTLLSYFLSLYTLNPPHICILLYTLHPTHTSILFSVHTTSNSRFCPTLCSLYILLTLVPYSISIHHILLTLVFYSTHYILHILVSFSISTHCILLTLVSYSTLSLYTRSSSHVYPTLHTTSFAHLYPTLLATTS